MDTPQIAEEAQEVLRYTLPEHERKKIIFVLTNACNIKCKHCYNEFLEQTEDRAIDKEAIYRTADKIIEYFDDLFNPEIILHGGEPFSFPPEVFDTLLRKLSKKFTTAGLQSNLTLLTKEHLEVFDKVEADTGLKVNVSSSFDFDDGLGRPVTKEDWLAKVKLLVDSGRKLSTITCLSLLNLNETILPKFVEAHETGLTGWKLSFIDDGTDYAIDKSTFSEIYSLMVKHLTPVLDYCVINKIHVSPLAELVTFTTMGHGVDCARNFCHHTKTFIDVSYTGDMYPCARLKAKDDLCGNIHTDTTYDIMRRYDMIRSNYALTNFFAEKKPVCKTCAVADFCGGGGCEGSKGPNSISEGHCLLTLFIAEYWLDSIHTRLTEAVIQEYSDLMHTKLCTSRSK